MAKVEVPQVELTGLLELVLPSGEKIRVRPGPYGKGVAVIPVAQPHPNPAKPAAGGPRGRRPRESTVKLRKKLERDAEAGRLADNKTYVKWMLDKDATISLAVARQVVYRERRKHL